jgi:hypothetical protein
MSIKLSRLVSLRVRRRDERAQDMLSVAAHARFRQYPAAAAHL